MISWKSVLQFLSGAGGVLALGLAAVSLIPHPKPPPGWQTIRPPKDVLALVEYRGAILSGGKDGLVRIDRHSGQVLEQIQADVRIQYVTSLVLDGGGGYWVGHSRGVSHFDGNAWRTFTTAGGLPDNQVLALALSRAGELWVGTPKGVARQTANAWQVFHKADGLASEAASVIFEDRQGRLWFGDGHTTIGGLSRFDGQSWQTFSPADGLGIKDSLGRKDSLAHNVVNAIMEDRQGNLWFATGFSSQGGLSRFDGVAWKTLHQADGLAGGKARSLFQDSNGSLWVGSEYDGIVRFDGDPFQVQSTLVTPKQGLAGWEVKAMLEDSAGDLWLGTENGITRIMK